MTRCKDMFIEFWHGSTYCYAFLAGNGGPIEVGELDKSQDIEREFEGEERESALESLKSQLREV